MLDLGAVQRPTTAENQALFMGMMSTESNTPRLWTSRPHHLVRHMRAYTSNQNMCICARVFNTLQVQPHYHKPQTLGLKPNAGPF